MASDRKLGVLLGLGAVGVLAYLILSRRAEAAPAPQPAPTITQTGPEVLAQAVLTSETVKQLCAQMGSIYCPYGETCAGGKCVSGYCFSCDPSKEPYVDPISQTCYCKAPSSQQLSQQYTQQIAQAQPAPTPTYPTYQPPTQQCPPGYELVGNTCVEVPGWGYTAIQEICRKTYGPCTRVEFIYKYTGQCYVNWEGPSCDPQTLLKILDQYGIKNANVCECIAQPAPSPTPSYAPSPTPTCGAGEYLCPYTNRCVKCAEGQIFIVDSATQSCYCKSFQSAAQTTQATQTSTQPIYVGVGGEVPLPQPGQYIVVTGPGVWD